MCKHLCINTMRFLAVDAIEKYQTVQRVVDEATCLVGRLSV